MPKFSANLAYLWNDLPICDAISAATKAGFAAVEFQTPYDTPAHDVATALKHHGARAMTLNTRIGDVGKDEFGLAALPGREETARAFICDAFEYADVIDALGVHVIAGRTAEPTAIDVFVENLKYASDLANRSDKIVLIEPLNRFDVPGYFLPNLDSCLKVLKKVDRRNVKLMFDCYHVAKSGDDVEKRIAEVFENIGHIQFASPPNRTKPDEGNLDFGRIFKRIDQLGWRLPIGAEYKTNGPTEQSLSWMTAYKNDLINVRIGL